MGKKSGYGSGMNIPDSQHCFQDYGAVSVSFLSCYNIPYTEDRLGFTCMKQLYGDVILAGSVYGAVETKPNHENPPVHNKSAK
jgi:hypothetical protein